MGVEVLLCDPDLSHFWKEHDHEGIAKIRNRIKKNNKNERLLQPSTAVVT